MAFAKQASVGWARDADDLRAALRGVSNDVKTKILKDAVGAACEPILAAAKNFAKHSERTGALRSSLVMKVVGYPATAKAVGMVGPDRKYYHNGAAVQGLTALFAGRRGELRRPANYAHLVEFGHRVAHGGTLRDKHKLTLVGTGRYGSKGNELKRWKKGEVTEKAKGIAGGTVAPKPFLRPAVVSTRSQQHAAFIAAVGKGLDSSLRRNNRAAGSRIRYQRAA